LIRPLLVLVALQLGSCEYRRDLGDLRDTDQAATADGGTGCADFVPPSGDCTLAGTECLIVDGCAVDQTCNTFHRRCYPSGVSCVGTQCNIDQDCGTGAVCNQFAGVCFDPRESQACMPCIAVTMCGPSEACDVESNRCTE
jgi:hypothetical protein